MKNNTTIDLNNYDKIRFIFDVEAQSLHKEGFAYGYVVTAINKHNKRLEILEEGECYSIEGAQGSSEWVKENVLPALETLTNYIKMEGSAINKEGLPKDIVITTRELRDRFYNVYMQWKKRGAEIWSDVGFPVETNFLSAIIKDGEGTRDWDGPYPLKDIGNFLDVNTSRKDYSLLPNLKEHNPRDDAKASAYSLHRLELQQKQLQDKGVQQSL